jgi:hypothetical protein
MAGYSIRRFRFFKLRAKSFPIEVSDDQSLAFLYFLEGHSLLR